MAELTIAEAAERLAISKETLRTRVKRGKVRAHKGADGQWRITIPDHIGAHPLRAEPVHEPVREPSSGLGRNGASETVALSSTARMQLDALRDEWLLPLMDRIAALERENGRLEAAANELPRERERREQAEQERDDLRARLETLESPVRPAERFTAYEGTQNPNAAPGGVREESDPSQRPRASWWRRFFFGEE